MEAIVVRRVSATSFTWPLSTRKARALRARRRRRQLSITPTCALVRTCLRRQVARTRSKKARPRQSGKGHDHSPADAKIEACWTKTCSNSCNVCYGRENEQTRFHFTRKCIATEKVPVFPMRQNMSQSVAPLGQ